eukprot:scaffold65043_cov21-Tisochrysis_lutea.AAC.3
MMGGPRGCCFCLGIHDEAMHDDIAENCKDVTPEQLQIHQAAFVGLEGGVLPTSVVRTCTNAWRNHFVLEENMLELECPAVTPEVVLKASGHVESVGQNMICLKMYPHGSCLVASACVTAAGCRGSASCHCSCCYSVIPWAHKPLIPTQSLRLRKLSTIAVKALREGSSRCCKTVRLPSGEGCPCSSNPYSCASSANTSLQGKVALAAQKPRQLLGRLAQSN